MSNRWKVPWRSSGPKFFRKKGLMYAILVALLLLGGSFIPQFGVYQSNVSYSTVTSDSPLVLQPSADTFVSSAKPTQNYGKETILQANSSPAMQSLVRFDIPELAGGVTKATLRVYSKSKHATGFSVLPVADSTWDELKATWKSMPAVGSSVVGESGPLPHGWAEVDVTSVVAGSGQVSLALVSGKGNLSLSSREASAKFVPQLVISTEGQGTVPQPEPSPTPEPTPSPEPSPTPQPSPSPSPEPSPSPTPPAPAPDPDPVDQQPAPKPGSGANAVAPGTMNLTSTFNSVGVELFFSGDDNQNAVANLQFKRAGESTWRAALPLWGTYANDAPGRAFYGSALLLDADTNYDIRVSFNDPDGVNGPFTVTGKIATRADNVPAASSLKATHFVSPSGNDSNNGTSAGSAWKTIEKAFTAAPSGAVVQVAAGSYAPPTSARTQPITLVGNGAVIEPQTIAKANSGAWTQVKLTGPATKQSYTVWKWTSPLADANKLTLEASGMIPEAVAVWDRPSKDFGAYTMTTPQGWAEVVYRNDLYNYGFATFDKDIYLRLPGDRNPNNFTVRVHQQAGYDKGRILLNASNIRVTGFEIKMVSLTVQPNGDNAQIDHNKFVNTDVYFVADPNSTPKNYPTNPVVEDNSFVHTSLYSKALDHNAIAWKFVKGPLLIDGQKTGWNRLGSKLEVNAIAGRGGANGLVLRRNAIEGYFNGVGAYAQGFDRYATANYDLYDNTISYIADDVFEPEQNAINWRVWNNHVSYSSVQVSFGPIHYGPFYLFRNTFSPMTNDGVGADKTGDTMVRVLGFKYSGDSNPAALAYVISNTFWSDDSDALGGNNAAGGSGSPERFFLRNNIFVMSRYVFSAKSNTAGANYWDEDYNAFYTSDPKRGFELNGKNVSTLERYRELSGQGTHSNPHGGFHDPIPMADPQKSNFRSNGSSPLVDAGVTVPNIVEAYNGQAPDIGADEN